MWWWLIIVPPVCVVIVGCFVPLLCRIDVLIIVLCTFINVVHWDPTIFHCVAWLSTLVANDLSFSLSCWLAVGLSFTFVVLSFKRHSLSNLSFPFCWLWSVVSLLVLTVASVTFSFVALFAFLAFVFSFSFSFVFSFADCSYVHWCCSSTVVCWDCWWWVLQPAECCMCSLIFSDCCTYLCVCWGCSCIEM